MCGILGTYNVNLNMELLLRRQAHRGPDAMASASFSLPQGPRLHLGHNRLKILCLSDDANQPLHDASGGHHLIFNGEIYNYLEVQQELQSMGVVFRTSSDSEVLLQALKHWGINALKKLNGMFAFAYYNQHAQILYLVRDRFGVKPLFYFKKAQQLMFASTSALIADALALKPNFDYLKKGLQYGIFEDDSSATAYEHLNSVRPGCYLRLRLAENLQAQEIPFYDFKLQVEKVQDGIQHLNPMELQDHVVDVLSAASAVRLKADVPVAVTLSGGLDSSTIAVLAKQRDANIQAFCFGDPQDTSSEGVLAKKLSNLHQIDTTFVTPTEDDWEEAFWQTLHHQDAPYAGISVVAQHLLYKKIKAQGVKVVLGGQGGDEAFLGYRKFQLFYLKELIEKRKWRAAMQNFYVVNQMLWAERSRLMNFWRMRSKYTQRRGNHSNLQLPGAPVALNFGHMGHIQDRQIADILQYSLPTLLRYEDRNSMAHSVESRLPFMDYRLLELACALPVTMKLKKGYGKWVVRAAMQDHLPDEIRLARYKRGFDVASTQRIYQRLHVSVHRTFAKNKDFYQSLLPQETLEKYFNPANLHRYQQRFTELTVMLWLGSRV